MNHFTDLNFRNQTFFYQLDFILPNPTSEVEFIVGLRYYPQTGGSVDTVNQSNETPGSSNLIDFDYHIAPISGDYITGGYDLSFEITAPLSDQIVLDAGYRIETKKVRYENFAPWITYNPVSKGNSVNFPGYDSYGDALDYSEQQSLINSFIFLEMRYRFVIQN